jgi:hypothetical protein
MAKVKSYLLVLALALVALPAAAEDWKTTDGTIYVDVKVKLVEDDAVTILYRDGGALVPLYKLPPALQERFGYDPVKAKIAAERRSKADAENALAMQAEIEKADRIKRQQQIEIARQLGNTNAAPQQ